MAQNPKNPPAGGPGPAGESKNPYAVPGQSGPAPGAAPPQQQRVEFPVDTSQLSTVYANFTRGTWTPEEMILDFGLNSQVTPDPKEPVRLTHRLVINFYTAKRLLGLLQMAIQQHESMFGAVETDINKRASPRM
jgi:hypothetical protein